MMKKQSKIEQIKAKKREYTYTTLDKLEMATENVNFYGVVLEATFPHSTKQNYVCSLKVADLTSKFDANGIVQYVSLVIFAKKFDDLPVC